MSCWLETKSWPEAEEAIAASGGVAIVPIGSVEQHSLHLPLGTDSYVAITLAEDAGEQTGAVVTPPVWFGWSPHHMVRPGTITIRPEVMADLTYDIIKSLAHHGLTKIVLINGHRIVNTTEISLAGDNVNINGTPTAPPYAVKAIGKPDTLESAITIRFGILEQMRSYGIRTDMIRQDEIVIPRYSGVITFRYAKPVIYEDGE